LDLDETLIYNCQGSDVKPEHIIEVIEEGTNKKTQIKIKIRPYVKEFLETLLPHYEILVFTASSKLYA